jgi:DNA modification methylase
LKGTMRRAAPRVYKPTETSAAHLNQKPLEFMERIIYAATDPGEVVWEPFGGLASASVAAVALGRRPFAAELDDRFARLAAERLQLAVRERDVAAEGETVTM